MTLSRRKLLISAGLLTVLSGCQAAKTFETVGVSVNTAATKVAIIADAFDKFIPAIKTVGNLSSSLAQKITTGVDMVRTVAADLTTAASGSASSLVKVAEEGISMIAQAFGSVKSLPHWMSVAINDAQLLLPAIKLAVGLLVPGAPPPDVVAAAEDRLRALARS